MGLMDAATQTSQVSGLTTSQLPAMTTTQVPALTTGTAAPQITSMAAAPVTEYTPTQRTVDPTKETVAGQFATLTSSDNPLMTMARTGAAQQANKRGLMNSSMAIGAADMAAYQAALPIAQADSATYTQAARENAAYGNEALRLNANASNEAAANQLKMAGDLVKTNLDSAMKIQLATIESDYKTVMQTSATAAEIYKQAMKNITDIAANTSMNAAAKETATQNQFYALKNGMELAGAMAGLNLGELLNFTDAPTGGVADAATPVGVQTVMVGNTQMYRAEDGSTWQTTEQAAAQNAVIKKAREDAASAQAYRDYLAQQAAAAAQPPVYAA